MPPSLVSATLERFFLDQVPAQRGDRILVAFSGGPDSTALLAGLLAAAPRLGVEIHALHVDHQLDPGSSERALRCRALAEALEVSLHIERLAAPPSSGESLEAWARTHRYGALRARADLLGARWIATAHHADDQAETVLLRLLFGSGWRGLGGIHPCRGRLVRPLLALPRNALAEAVPRDLEPLVDPTNFALERPRNRIRHHLLPRLEAETPEITARLGRLASAARAAARRVDALLESALAPRPLRDPLSDADEGLTVERRAFTALPTILRRPALALLHRRVGASYPAGDAAYRELERQLDAVLDGRASRLGCDCGDGRRWESTARTLDLIRTESSPGDFAYTLEAPGDVDIEELGLHVRLRRRPFAPWMLSGQPRRAALTGFAAGCRIEIRNRCPGDRLRPLGGQGHRRLKELLIDRGVPQRRRDRLPLLLVEGRIAWVPGITIDERFRLSPGPPPSTVIWVVEIEPSAPPGGRHSSEERLES